MRMSDPGEFGLFLAVGGTLMTLFLGPIGQAIAHRVRGKSASQEGLSTGEMTAERIAALEERIAELESERAQLEERLDFAERMLTRGPQESQREVPSS